MSIIRILLLAFLLIVQDFPGLCQAGNSWKPKKVTIPTKWTDAVTPNHVQWEYPRPMLVRNSNWINLNGLWQYCILDSQKIAPFFNTDSILVPFPIESALSGVQKKLLPSQFLWYKREFNYHLDKSKRLILHFGAVDWKATVFINGKKIATHTGGYNSFSCDISDKIKSGSNTIIVQVYDPTDKGIGPHGKQVLNPSNIYYTPTSGIWQTVWVEEVPLNYIERVSLISNIDNGEVQIKSKLNGSPKGFSIRATILQTGRSSVSAAEKELYIVVNNAHLWSPDDPFLYDIKLELIDKSGNVVDSVATYVGMRKVDIQKDPTGHNRIFLNNKYLFNLGVLDQGFWPDGLYTAPSDSAMAYDIKIIKAMGFNTIRKHIKVEPERWYYHADKIGMLVWQDFVNPNQSLPPGAKAEFEKDMCATVSQLYNHPSIITWVLFNEKWGQYDQKRLTEQIKKLDSSRLVNGHSGELLYVNDNLRSPSPDAYISSDMTDVHSYPYPRISPMLAGKVRVVGEFGGIGVPVAGQLWDDLTPGWGYQGVGTPDTLRLVYSKMIDSLVSLEKMGLAASIYTQPFDVESEQNGILTYNRMVLKISLDTIREINKRVIKSGNFPVNKLDYIPDVVVDQSSKMEILSDRYEAGWRDSSFLRQLAIQQLRMNDTLRKIKTLNDYFRTVKYPLCEDNLRLLFSLSNSVRDTGFLLVRNNMKVINQIYGNNAAENLIMRIIFQDEIEPLLATGRVDWDSLEARLVSKYGQLALEKINSSKVIFYADRKDWVQFGKYYKKHFDNVLITGRNNLHINNISWPIFLHVDDSSVLNTAVNIMKYNIDRFDSGQADAIDTYANLLYKLGRKSEAIEQERKAMSLSEDSIFRKTYEKMLRNERTWESIN